MYIVYRDKAFLTKPIDLVVQQISLLLVWLHCNLGHSFRLFRPTRFNNIFSKCRTASVCTIRSHIFITIKVFRIHTMKTTTSANKNEPLTTRMTTQTRTMARQDDQPTILADLCAFTAHQDKRTELCAVTAR